MDLLKIPTKPQGTKMKNTKKLAVLAALFAAPLVSNAAIVYENCYVNTYSENVCNTSTETLSFDILGTAARYQFDKSAGGGQASIPDTTENIVGSLNVITTTDYSGGYGNITSITGSFSLMLSNLPAVTYNAIFTQDAFTQDVSITSETLDGITWTIDTPTLWEFYLTADGGIALNTIQNNALGNYSGFNPLDGVLLQSGGPYTATYFAFDVAATGTLSAVPVPAAVWLFASGLIGLAGFAKRKPS